MYQIRVTRTAKHPKGAASFFEINPFTSAPYRFVSHADAKAAIRDDYKPDQHTTLTAEWVE